MAQACFTSPDRELLEIAVWQTSPDSVIVVLSGELDLATAPKVRSSLADLYRLGITNVMIDLANLTFIDSVGLSVLITVAKRVRAAEGTLAVRNANRPVLKSFEMAGLMDFLSVSSDEEGAAVTETPEPAFTGSIGAA
jgi:anti-sigma B factor antagonist